MPTTPGGEVCLASLTTKFTHSYVDPITAQPLEVEAEIDQWTYLAYYYPNAFAIEVPAEDNDKLTDVETTLTLEYNLVSAVTEKQWLRATVPVSNKDIIVGRI